MKYIETYDSLSQACSLISCADLVSMDTEADSLHHYYEKLCLVQVSIEEEDFVIDTLAIPDLSSLFCALQDKLIIFHGADFDIRILKKTYGYIPDKIFDTMLAAQLLGLEKQGYADLVSKYCGIELSKVKQKADWSIRPLSESCLRYAANDTHYLRVIADIMTAHLLHSGRIDWHRQNCARLLRSASSERSDTERPRQSWKVKGSGTLQPEEMRLLRALWLWRDNEAKSRDIPSFRILLDQQLLDITRWAHKHPGVDIINFRAAPDRVICRYRDTLNTAIATCEDIPWEDEPRVPAGRDERWRAEEYRLLDYLKSECREIAEKLEIAPSLVVTTNIMKQIVIHLSSTGNIMDFNEVLLPWQVELIGKRFTHVMTGYNGSAANP